MKKILFILALTAGSLQQSSAQTTNGPVTPDQILIYYTIKDALVNSQPELAATQATAFTAAVRNLVHKDLHENNRSELIKDAGLIAATKDIKKQREYFSTFSADMLHLAHDIKLSEAPVYQMYCPMKKAGWLSKESNIRNPYFGSSMLTCGAVTETIK
jgi:hypothetical protein